MDPFDKKNYRPVSILPLLSKVYETIIFEQVLNHFEPVHSTCAFWSFLCAFKKAHCTQHASFSWLTSWQTSLSRGGFVGSLLMDLSKVYDGLKDDLLLAKLQAYGFSKNL